MLIIFFVPVLCSCSCSTRLTLATPRRDLWHFQTVRWCSELSRTSTASPLTKPTRYTLSLHSVDLSIQCHPPLNRYTLSRLLSIIQPLSLTALGGGIMVTAAWLVFEICMQSNHLAMWSLFQELIRLSFYLLFSANWLLAIHKTSFILNS